MKDLNTKSMADLKKLLTEKRESLQDFRFGSAGSKTRNVKEGRNIKKDIARIMTALTVLSYDAAAKKEVKA